MGTSIYAKKHKISEAQFLKAASKKESKLAISMSVDVLAIQGNQNLFLDVSPSNEVASTGSPACLAQLGQLPDPRPGATAE